MSKTEHSQAASVIGPCPLCNATAPKLHFPGQVDDSGHGTSAYRCTTATRSRPAVYACDECGHWFTNPYEWPVALGSEYVQLEDEEYLALMDVKRRTFRRAADLVCQFVSAPASVLEVGSYAGLFLDEMASRGFRIEGIEPSIWGVRVSRERGHTVTQGAAEEILGEKIPGAFDAVVSWDVLEHVPDPQTFVALLASATKPGGTVVVSTLDRSNWFPRLMGKRWPWIIPMHLHYFDQDTVKHLAYVCHLQFLHTSRHVHYTTPTYALKRLVRKVDSEGKTSARLVFPVGFGDVRTYVFRKPASEVDR